MPEFVEKAVTFKINTVFAMFLVAMSSATTFGITVGRYRQEFEGVRQEVVEVRRDIKDATSTMIVTNENLAKINGKLEVLEDLLKSHTRK
jgi:uncharacterized ion transporter superfamily protein YfcC